MITFVFITILALMYFSLAKRVARCEEKLERMQKIDYTINSTPPIPQRIVQPAEAAPLFEKELPKPPPMEPLAIPVQLQETPRRVEAPADGSSIEVSSFRIPCCVKDNWMGVIGSMALVIGAVFFGLTSDFFSIPQVRVGLLLFFALMLLGISFKLRGSTQWETTCGLLKSTAAAIILFSSLGAGSLEGLRFIEFPSMALGVLCVAVAFNIFLAAMSHSQPIASLHVVLSILAFSVAPQAVILLPLGAVVAIAGLVIGSRSRWDLHLLLIVSTYSIQNMLWTRSLIDQLTPMTQLLAIILAAAVGGVAAAIHYSKKYKFSKLEALPLVAHITNWALLAWNISMHTQFLKGSFLILGLIAAAGFILARTAKKKGIIWLYRTDTILAQIMALAAIANIDPLMVTSLNISLLALLEVIAFTAIFNLQKEDVLIRAGYFLQLLIYPVILFFYFAKLHTIASENLFSLYGRLLAITAISWGYHIYGRAKSFKQDSMSYIIFGKETTPHAVSVMVVAGSVFFLIASFSSVEYPLMQCLSLFGLGALGFWRYKNEDASWNLAFFAVLTCMHIFDWLMLLTGPVSWNDTRIGYFGLVALDVIFVFGNWLRVKSWNRNVHDRVLYAMAIQIALITLSIFQQENSLMPTLAFLLYSFIALEAARHVPDKFNYDSAVKAKIQQGLLVGGFGFLFLFICRVIAMHLSEDSLWHGVQLRWITEALGLSALCYWMTYFPENDSCARWISKIHNGLVEVLLAFVTICVFVEFPMKYLSLALAAIALGVLTATLYFHWQRRLYLYSWMFLMTSIAYVALATKTQPLTAPDLLNAYHLPSFAAIALQLLYAAIAQKKQLQLRNVHSGDQRNFIQWFGHVIFRHPSITVLLPIFFGAALLLAFNYEKAILTLLWVGLACLYMGLGLLTRSELSIRIAMASLAICSLRLVVYDLGNSNLSTKALVFVGVGILMLLISMVYKKYKYRVESEEPSHVARESLKQQNRTQDCSSAD